MEKYKICPTCGAHNLPTKLECTECETDLSGVRVFVQKNEKNKITLVSLDKTFVYELKEGNTVIGREHEMSEYLEKRPYVSRTQAEFMICDEKIYIKNLSSTNFTFLNNRKICEEEFCELFDGDEIGLGGNCKNGERQTDAAYFVVRIEQLCM